MSSCDEARAEIERIDRLYHAIRLSNQAILRLHTRHELFHEICRIAVEYGGFALAWVGWIDAETRQVVPVEQYGEHSAFLSHAPMYANDRPHGRGPTGQAIRSGKPYICNDYFNDPATELWRDEAKKCGFLASGIFPIRMNQVVVGILGVYSQAKGYFLGKEIALLEEAAANISFALESFAREEERLKAQEDARQLAAIVESSTDAIISKSLDGRVTSWNPAAERMFGYSAEEILGQNVALLIPADRINEERELIACIRAGKQVNDYETIRMRKDGRHFPVSITLSPLRSARGEVIGASKIARDITERRNAEETLAREASRIRLLFDQAADAMFLLDNDYNVVELNASFATMLGRPAAEIMNLHAWDWDELYRTPEMIEAKWPKHASVPLAFETKIRRADGSLVDVDVSVTPTEWRGQHLFFHVVRDITERKRAQEALHRTQAQFEHIVQNLDEGLILADLHGKLLTWNPAAQRLFDIPNQATQHHELAEYAPLLRISNIDGDPLPFEQWPLSRVMRGEVLHDCEIRSQSCFCDCERILSFSGRIVHLGGGQELAFLKLKDVTEDKRAEEQIRHLATFAELMPSMVLEIDRQCKILYVNPALRALLAKLENHDPLQLVPVQWQKKIQQPGPLGSESEIVPFDVSGKNYQLMLLYLPQFQSLRVYGWEITDLKRAEADLRKTQIQFEAVIDSLDEGLMITDMQGNLLIANPAAFALRGLPYPNKSSSERIDYSDVIEISTIDGVVLPYEQWPMQRILRGEVLKNYEICFRRLDTGETRIFSYSGSIVHYENDKQLAFIKFQNITEHRRAETSLQEAQAQLLHSQKMEAVGLLAGGIAHDFNNALGVILGYCELLRERMAADDVNRKYVQQILNAEERAASLTHQLLAFSRKQLMNPAILDLNTVVRGMEEMVRRLIGADISLQLFCDAQLPGIKADYGQLEQVLMNLAVNSRDAMPQGGTLTIRTAYGEPVSDDAAKNPGIRDGKFVMLCVTDTGCGMDKATQERIFEPFFTTKEIGKGTGLGLSTTYGIVQQSGGCICLESAPGVGTTFRIYFPVAEEIPPPELPQKVSGKQVHGSETVLLADDDDAIRATLCEFLRVKGYRVYDTPDALTAMAIFDKNDPLIDLLITDVIMPGLSGPELVDQLRATHPHLKVIYITGYTDENLSRYGDFGVGSILLQKPFSAEALLTAVRDELDG